MKPAMIRSDQQSPTVGDLWSTEKNLQAADGAPGFLGYLSLVVALAIFLLDRMVPDWLSVSGLYVLVLYLAARLPRPRYFWMGVYGCTGLILLDLLMALPNQNPTLLFVSTGAGLLTVGVVTWILWTHVHETKKWKERERWLEERLQEQMGQLGVARIKVESSVVKRQESEQALAKLNDRLAQQNRELETILSVASHDLRSPLVNIQGFGKEIAKACAALQSIFAKDLPLSSKQQEMGLLIEQDIPEALHYIQAGAKKMDTLLQGILRLARLGQITLTHDQLDMNGMIGGIVAGMEYQLKEKEVTLQIDDLPPCFGDATLINQLFCNLLDNAHKYLDPSRKGIIQVCGIRDGEWVSYTVKDNGKGIHEEHQEEIFQMFLRLNPTETKGDGLGLTIVKRIVDRHHGVIKMESSPGTGTTFTISLPAG